MHNEAKSCNGFQSSLQINCDHASSGAANRRANRGSHAHCGVRVSGVDGHASAAQVSSTLARPMTDEGERLECARGRLEQGESFSDALRREAYEELSIEVQIDFIIGTGHFYRGDRRPENETHQWSAVLKSVNARRIRISLLSSVVP
jgi:hypothetical protein